MRTIIDIPDGILRRLKSQAALERCSVNGLILKSAKAALQPHQKRIQAQNFFAADSVKTSRKRRIEQCQDIWGG
jgi:hypothetical protein